MKKDRKRVEFVFFKRWSNKKYAVLASFHKLIIICTLSLSYNLVAQEPGTESSDSAQNTPHYTLEEVEAIAEEVPDLYAPSLRPLTVISQREISASPGSGLNDLLNFIPGIDIRQRGKHGVQADLNIQGGSFDQSMVLFNGMNISDPQTGHFSLNLPAGFSAFQSAEILAGPATKTYGTNAYNGAINVITRPYDSTGFDAGMHYGQYNYYKSFANLNLASKSTATLLHFNSASSKGYTENTDFKTFSGFLHSSWQTTKIATEFMAGWNQKKFGANSFYSPSFPDQYEETGTGFTAFKIKSRTLKPEISLNIYWRHNRDHFVLDRGNPDFYENFHQTNTLGADLKGTFSSRAGITSFGLSSRLEYLASTSLGEEVDNGRSVPGTELAYTHAFQRNHTSLILDQKIYIGKLSLSAGVLLHMSNHPNYKTALFPGIDLGYNLTDKHRIYLALNRSMRLPTFTDLFYSGPTNMGNPDLKPEHATTLQGGFQSSYAYLKGSINGFYRVGKDIIDWVWMEDARWHTMNFTELNTYGADVNLTLFPGNIRPAFKRIRHIRLAYQYTNQDKAPSDLISHYALDHLKHKFIVDIDHRIVHHLYINWKILYQAREGEYLKFNPETRLSESTPFEPFWLADVRIRYELGRWRVFLEASNLLNTDYFDIGNVSQPGRWIIAGIEIR